MKDEYRVLDKLRKTVKEMMNIIPASPGWFVLTPIHGDADDETISFAHEPVVAWVVETTVFDDFSRYFSVDAVCPTINDEADVLLRPDGRVEFLGDQTFENEEDALREWICRENVQKHLNQSCIAEPKGQLQ